MSELDLDELRAELDGFAAPEKKSGRSPREERIIAGFEEIQRFVESHGHTPQHGEDRDIFERLYAVRLDRLRTLEECRSRNLLRRSLQRALYKDEAGRRITDPAAGPLFAGEAEDGDLESGTIYVLRSKSDSPTVAANRDVLHKIGVTGGDVKARIANAKLDPTFLLADVEIVATYKLSNVNRTKLENVIHRIFDPGRLNIEIKDRFGNPVIPREWFLVPVFVIDEAVERIKDGTITSYRYDPNSAKLVYDAKK
jgi:hypothetical protein